MKEKRSRKDEPQTLKAAVFFGEVFSNFMTERKNGAMTLFAISRATEQR